MGLGSTNEQGRALPVMRVQLLKPQLASVPRYASDGASGLDLSAALEAPLTLSPGRSAAVPTGIAIELPEGYEGQVRPRSGLAAKHAVTVLNAPGTIDADYRGEVRVLLVNLGSEPYLIQPGDRVAQLVIAPVTKVAVEATESALETTARGAGGFGSTGR
jgi:dUTP pyrophosphatase